MKEQTLLKQRELPTHLRGQGAARGLPKVLSRLSRLSRRDYNSRRMLGLGRHSQSGPRRHSFGPTVQYSRSMENAFLVEMLRSLSITHTQRFFDRRVERVVWAPRSRTALAVGSHGGDVYLWNYEDELRTAKIVDGCGRGGAINDMKFCHDGERKQHPHTALTATLLAHTSRAFPHQSSQGVCAVD